MSEGPAAANAPRRIVVFTSGLSYTVRKGIAAIDEAQPGLQWLVLVRQQKRTLGRLYRSQRMNIKRNGWRWIPYQMGEVLRRLTAPRGGPEPVAPAPGHAYSLHALLGRPNVRIEKVDDIHAPAVISQVQQFQPDLGLSLAAPILKRALFGVPRLGSINLHKGKLPDFRGMPPAFWELWHDQTSVGCSVHCIDEKLDTGALLGEGTVKRARHSTVKGLQLELDELAIDLTRDCALAMLDGTAKPRPQPRGEGATYRKPTLVQQAQLRAKLAEPRDAAAATKAAIKDTLATTLLGAHRLGLGRLLRARVTVLLYHRVSDDARDNLTAGIEQFDRHMAWLSSHCRVLPIEAVLAMDTVPACDRPQVAITFDDGYLDNHRYAAPILTRHGLPAAFFVSTGIVDSDKPFPHDVRRGNPPIAKMSWDQLREMRDGGFTIGSHTVNHIDCAAETEDVVRQELALSRQHLADELGVQQPILAYPYGGRQHMTPARLELVKAAGYAGCLSAYGGTNVGRVDRFNVLRRAVSCAFSDRSFQRLCLGLW